MSRRSRSSSVSSSQSGADLHETGLLARRPNWARDELLARRGYRKVRDRALAKSEQQLGEVAHSPGLSGFALRRPSVVGIASLCANRTLLPGCLSDNRWPALPRRALTSFTSSSNRPGTIRPYQTVDRLFVSDQCPPRLPASLRDEAKDVDEGGACIRKRSTWQHSSSRPRFSP